MSSLSFVIFTVIVFLINFSCSWVFTEVDFTKIQDTVYQDEMNEIDDSEISIKFSLIYPGTKWCGAGNVADGYDDLGSDKVTDMCCRTHDHCEDVISAGETNHNLTNNAFYTRLHCDCDELFRQCLRASSTKTAKQIGYIYFNTLGTTCFREDFLIKRCKRRGGWLKTKCVEYEFDLEADKSWQWFDVPNF